MSSTLRCFPLLLLIGLLSCNMSISKEVYDEGIVRVKVYPTKGNINYLFASEVISDVEYIPLETSDQCLIGEYFSANISENYILVHSRSQCVLFSRQGKYIRHIGSQGNGPEEYKLVSGMSIDEKSCMVYISSLYELLVYRISGEFVKKLNLNNFKKTSGISGSFGNVKHLKDDLFCSDIVLFTGEEPYGFVIFSLEGNVVKLFTNYTTFESGNSFSGIFFFSDLYPYNGQLNFREMYSDTLFLLNDQLEFVPKVIFDLCGRKIPTKMRGAKDIILSAYTYVMHIHELENYILFTCDFGDIRPKNMPEMQSCLYDKKSNKLTVFKQDLLGQRLRTIPSMPGVYSDSNELLVDYYSEGIINDIDGGYDFGFLPSQVCFIQNTHQLLCKRCQPFELLRDLTEEYFASKKIKNKEAHERLKNILANLDGDDNPVLMIATFK